MKKLLLLIACVVFYGFCAAQTASVKGIVTDTINKQNLPNTVVSVLRAKDSILVKFTRANAKGGFELKGLQAGNYLLLVTYPQYADYAEAFALTDSSALNTGEIKLILKANLLKEVIVKQQLGAIRLKGDTTEFVADSFKVQANANVEDLLKKMPGIQIDKNGKITAQGETVKKVLVEGEEFFGDDPTLVTQNLRADMVDKVQVYDKKSDQAAFTGIDDGKKEKTINLKLKDDKKNGYFGKLNLGGGTNGYFDNQAMFNLFKKKEKFAAYGIVSNTGKTGLNWQDQNNYGDNALSGAEYDEANGYYFISGSGDDLDSWNGQYSGQGNPRVQTGGLHYNNKWADDKQAFNGNYKFMNLDVNGTSTNNSNSILGNDSINYTNDYQKFRNTIFRNKAGGAWDWTLDSTSSLKFTVNGSHDHKTTVTYDSSESLTNSNLVNNSIRGLSTKGDNSTLMSSLLWKKKMAKKGRTLSLNVTENYTGKTTTGYLNSTIDTFTNNIFAGAQNTNQYKTYNGSDLSVDSKLTYSEPLSKISSLVANYGVIIDNSNANHVSYNRSADGKYDQFDSVYSNNYKFNVFTQRGGIAYNFIKKKIRFNIGNNIGFSNFKQTNLINSATTNRSFVNWYPEANISYSFTQQSRLNFSYNGNTRQPTLQQIQPVITNDNPLNVTIGNPSLKPEFDNRLNVNFGDFKLLSERYINLGANYNFSENGITSSSNFDASGKRTNQSINLTGAHNFSSYLYVTFKLKKINSYLSFNGNFNASRNLNMLNNVLNITNSGNYTGGISMNKDKEKKFSVSLSANATYTTSTSSIQQGTQTNYWTYEIQPYAEVYLPFKFQVHADGDYNIRQKTPAFSTNTNVFLLNAWLGKKMLKGDQLLVKVSANDLLNQNIGFNRTVTSNFTTQNTYTTIRRYFMLSVVWNFTKAGLKAPSQN